MDVYEKLKKIKKPVLIAVYRNNELYKLRILRPYGLCTWTDVSDAQEINKPSLVKLFNNELFKDPSCFIRPYGEHTLSSTVNAMQLYDKDSDYTNWSGARIRFTTQLVGTIEL
jgi:hypothetical protein